MCIVMEFLIFFVFNIQFVVCHSICCESFKYVGVWELGCVIQSNRVSFKSLVVGGGMIGDSERVVNGVSVRLG